MKKHNPILLPVLLSWYLLFAVEKTEAFSGTALSLQATADAAAAGVTFKTFPDWIGRIEAAGKLSNRYNFGGQVGPTPYQRYTIGVQTTLFWSKKYGNYSLLLGPSLELPIVDNELTKSGSDWGSRLPKAIPWLAFAWVFPTSIPIDFFGEILLTAWSKDPYEGFYGTRLLGSIGLRWFPCGK